MESISILNYRRLCLSCCHSFFYIGRYCTAVMHKSLLLIVTFALISTSAALQKPDALSQKLNSLSEKIDQIELLLNHSIDKVLNQIDESNHDLKNMIKAHFSSVHTGELFLSSILQDRFHNLLMFDCSTYVHSS